MAKLRRRKEILPVHAHICSIAGDSLAAAGIGKRDDAQRYSVRALAMCIKHFGHLEAAQAVTAADAMLLAKAWNRAGFHMLHDSNFAIAGACFVEALWLQLGWAHVSTHPRDFGETCQNLAFVLLEIGHLKLAWSTAVCGFRLRRWMLPTPSAAVQQARIHKGTVLQSLGQFDLALFGVPMRPGREVGALRPPPSPDHRQPVRRRRDAPVEGRTGRG